MPQGRSPGDDQSGRRTRGGSANDTEQRCPVVVRISSSRLFEIEGESAAGIHVPTPCNESKRAKSGVRWRNVGRVKVQATQCGDASRDLSIGCGRWSMATNQTKAQAQPAADSRARLQRRDVHRRRIQGHSAYRRPRENRRILEGGSVRARVQRRVQPDGLSVAAVGRSLDFIDSHRPYPLVENPPGLGEGRESTLMRNR